jgi:hypothetical protein
MADDKECYLEFKHYGRVIRFGGLSNDMGMAEFHNQCRLMALAISYAPETVEKYFGDEWDE